MWPTLIPPFALWIYEISLVLTLDANFFSEHHQ